MAEGTLTFISFVLTLMVFSYVLGDLPLVQNLYRLAVYIFVGMTAAYTTIVTYEGVILPYLQDIQDPAASWTVLGGAADIVIFFTALLFGLLLLLKPIAGGSCLTNSVLAVVVAVSAATALVGALSGTLLPFLHQTAQLPAGVSSDLAALAEFLVMFIGTVTVLFYFQHQASRGADGAGEPHFISRALRWVGKVFVVVTLAAVYAAMMLSSLTVLTERIGFLFSFS